MAHIHHQDQHATTSDSDTQRQAKRPESDGAGQLAAHASEADASAARMQQSQRLAGQAALQRMAQDAPRTQQLSALEGGMHQGAAQRLAHPAISVTADGVAQFDGSALAELKGHLKKIPTYMHEAIWRWVALLGASAVLAYMTAGGSLLAQAAIFMLPTGGWLASGVLKLVLDRRSGSDGLKIGTGPLIEDTFHLATYSFPWWPGTYHAIRSKDDKVKDGSYIFILDLSGNFYYATAEDRNVEGAHLYVRHSQLAGGAKVKTAGRMNVSAGECTLTNESGHYWPGAETLSHATEFLAGVRVFEKTKEEAFVPKKDE